MLQVRRSNERGRGNHGWLDSRHTFSFADYFDPRHMGFGALRVINEDRVQAGAGFPPHSHKNMEIISYVLDGVLAHRDSLGNGSVIRRGDVQRMSAGTGVQHSEYNASATEPVHFLQIWILPARQGLPPSYEEKHFDASDLHGRWRLIASPDGRDGSVVIHQDAFVHAARWRNDETLAHRLAPGRKAYLHVAGGSLEMNGLALAAGDGVMVTAEAHIRLAAREPGEALLFDLA